MERSSGSIGLASDYGLMPQGNVVASATIARLDRRELSLIVWKIFYGSSEQFRYWKRLTVIRRNGLSRMVLFWIPCKVSSLNMVAGCIHIK